MLPPPVISAFPQSQSNGSQARTSFFFFKVVYIWYSVTAMGEKNRTGKKKKRTGTGHKALQSGTFRLPGVTTSDPTPLPEFPCLLAKATVH